MLHCCGWQDYFSHCHSMFVFRFSLTVTAEKHFRGFLATLADIQLLAIGVVVPCDRAAIKCNVVLYIRGM